MKQPQHLRRQHLQQQQQRLQHNEINSLNEITCARSHQFSPILHLWVLIFRSYHWSENFVHLPDLAILFITLFLYPIILLSSLDKEMISSSTVPSRLRSFYRTEQTTAALLFLSHSSKWNKSLNSTKGSSQFAST